MVKVNQIRAARGLLGWHQKDLAYMAGISELSVINIENNKTSPQKSTLDKIIMAFEMAGVGFTPDGVEEKTNVFTVFRGEQWYMEMLKDVENTLDAQPDTKKEWILLYPDERLSPPPVVEKMRHFRKKGIKKRCFIKEGNTYIPGPLNMARYIPRKHFDDSKLLHCYGDKVAINEQMTKATQGADKDVIIKKIKNEARVFIFRNAELAKFVRGLADLMWDILPQPDKTTAKKHELY